MAHSMYYNAVDLSAFGLTVEKGSRVLAPGSDRHTVRLRNQDGAISGKSTRGPAPLNYSAQIKGTSYADLKAKADSIVGYIADKEDWQLSTDETSGRYWWARLAGKADFRYLTPSLAKASLSFVADDPAAYDKIESEVNETLTLSGGSGSEGISVPVLGSDTAYPVIEISPNAATGNFAVSNEVRDEGVSWIAPGLDLVSGDKVWLESAPRLRESEDVGGWRMKIQRAAAAAPSVAMAGLEAVRFPALSHGTTNTLTFWGITGAVKITWRNRWLTN